MRFKTDENLPEDAAKLLQDAGHDAVSALAQALGGTPDPDLADICKAEQRAVVTLDAGFGNIRRYPPEEYPGLVVLQLRRQDKPTVIAVLNRLLHKFGREPLSGHLWIVEESRIRIRPGRG